MWKVKKKKSIKKEGNRGEVEYYKKKKKDIEKERNERKGAS